MMKHSSCMAALHLNGEDYFVVIGGRGPSSNNAPTQAGAQYCKSYGYQSCNEVHLYKLKTG